MVGVKFTAIFGTENRGSTVKLGDKEHLVTKKFLITKFDQNVTMNYLQELKIEITTFFGG